MHGAKMARYAIPCALVMHRGEALRQEKRHWKAAEHICLRMCGLGSLEPPFRFVWSAVCHGSTHHARSQPSTWPPCGLLRASNDHRVTPFLFRYNFYFLHETGFGSQRVHLISESYHYNTFIYIFSPTS
jgi:hypothetical protein